MSKHQHLIMKYQWKSREKFRKLPAVSVESTGYRIKYENAKLVKRFLQYILRKLGFSKFKKR